MVILFAGLYKRISGRISKLSTTYDSLRQFIQESVDGRPLKRIVENVADVEERITQSPKKSDS